MRRLAARSAGPSDRPCMRGLARADLLDVGHAAGRLEDGVHEERLGQPGLGLELGEQAVDVVDVLGALDLRDHDDVERSPTSVTAVMRSSSPHGESRELTRVQSWVSPKARRSGRPRPGRPGRPPCRSAGTPSSRLASSTSTVGGDVGDLGHHLRVRRREEVDHPRRPDRDLPDRLGRADGQRAEEVLGAAHAGDGT